MLQNLPAGNSSKWCFQAGIVVPVHRACWKGTVVLFMWPRVSLSLHLNFSSDEACVSYALCSVTLREWKCSPHTEKKIHFASGYLSWFGSPVRLPVCEDLFLFDAESDDQCTAPIPSPLFVACRCSHTCACSQVIPKTPLLKPHCSQPARLGTPSPCFL